VRTALQDAASVAGILITPSAAVADAPKKSSGGNPGGKAAWATWTSRSGRSRLTKAERAGPMTGPPNFVCLPVAHTGRSVWLL